MINNVARQICRIFLKYDIVSEEDKEIYLFGIISMLMYFVHNVILLIVGLIFGDIWGIIEFIFFYSILRQVAGGHHFRSKNLCFISSVILAFLLEILLYYLWRIEKCNMYSMILFLLGAGITWFLAPLGNENRELNRKEDEVYKRKTRRTLFVFTALYILGTLADLRLAYVIAYSVLIEGIGLIVAEIQKKIITK